ncbi:DUF169 domain-containing protein [Desulfothermobacter acidiphilus]|uniref:DUF169 domain-containing protein n=1 Tax=Desulfothermobacter acidiphilus TaxID=1938353 RepID=UPI003F88C7C5
MKVLTYQEMQEVLMEELRLMHYPVAVKYILAEEELEEFRRRASYCEAVRPLTFCQFELGARMKGYTLLITKDKMGCSNAAFVLGWKPFDDNEIKSHLKYVRDWEQASKFVTSKPRLPEGSLKAIVVSPLGSAYCEPDVVHLYCDNMQAYHLAVDYMAALDLHPLRSNFTINSAACAGCVFAYQEKMATVHPACSGSYNAGKTERGEINVMIPGEHIGAVVNRLLERIEKYGSSSITRPGDPFPGADICKNCPLIVFREVKEAQEVCSSTTGK